MQGPDPMVQHRGMLSRVVTGLGGCNVSDLFWHFLGEKNSKTNYRQCCCMSSEKHRKIRLQEVCLLGLHYCIFTFLERRGRKAPFCCTTWMCFAVHSVTVSQCHRSNRAQCLKYHFLLELQASHHTSVSKEKQILVTQQDRK